MLIDEAYHLQVAVIAFSNQAYPPPGLSGESCYTYQLAVASNNISIAYLTDYINGLRVRVIHNCTSFVLIFNCYVSIRSASQLFKVLLFVRTPC